MENWKPIEGFETYAVSDLGRIKRTLPGRGTQANRILRPSVLKGRKGLAYLYVTLHVDGEATKRYVHVLVAKAFIPNPLDLPEVNHLGPKSDCRAIKLAWTSKAGNHRHAVKTGRTSGDGVYFQKSTGNWLAGFAPLPRQWKHLGSFATQAEAQVARDRAVASLPHIQ